MSRQVIKWNLTPENLKKLISELLIIGLIVALVISVFVGYYRNKANLKRIEDLKAKAFAKDTKHAMQIDSLKLVHLHDSLRMVDLERINRINSVLNQDKNDKDEHDEVIRIIPTANDKQRDQLWSTYTPKN